MGRFRRSLRSVRLFWLRHNQLRHYRPRAQLGRVKIVIDNANSSLPANWPANRWCPVVGLTTREDQALPAGCRPVGAAGPATLHPANGNESVVAALWILLLSSGFVRLVDVMPAVGEFEPALCHQYQKFAVCWIARLAGQCQALDRALAVTLYTTHNHHPFRRSPKRRPHYYLRLLSIDAHGKVVSTGGSTFPCVLEPVAG